MWNAQKRRLGNDVKPPRLGPEKVRDNKPASNRPSTLSSGGDLMAPSLGPQTPAYNFERLLDATETAKLVHCHVKTLERYARQGTIQGYKIHGRWYFRASELDSWVRAHVKSSRHPCRMN